MILARRRRAATSSPPRAGCRTSGSRRSSRRFASSPTAGWWSSATDRRRGRCARPPARTSNSSASCRGRRLRDLLRAARAFVFAAEEDFGILPVEAQACGTPVIAYGRGGVRETVVGHPAPGATGLFFAEQSPGAIAEAVRDFDRVAERLPARVVRAERRPLRRTPVRRGVRRPGRAGGWESGAARAIIGHAAQHFEAPRVALRRGAPGQRSAGLDPRGARRPSRLARQLRAAAALRRVPAGRCAADRPFVPAVPPLRAAARRQHRPGSAAALRRLAGAGRRRRRDAVRHQDRRRVLARLGLALAGGWARGDAAAAHVGPPAAARPAPARTQPAAHRDRRRRNAGADHRRAAGAGAVGRVQRRRFLRRRPGEGRDRGRGSPRPRHAGRPGSRHRRRRNRPGVGRPAAATPSGGSASCCRCCARRRSRSASCPTSTASTC